MKNLSVADNCIFFRSFKAFHTNIFPSTMSVAFIRCFMLVFIYVLSFLIALFSCSWQSRASHNCHHEKRRETPEENVKGSQFVSKIIKLFYLVYWIHLRGDSLSWDTFHVLFMKYKIFFLSTESPYLISKN